MLLSPLVPVLQRQSLVQQNSHLLINFLLDILDFRTNYVHHFLYGALPLYIVHRLYSDTHRRINIGLTIEEALIFAIILSYVVAWV